MGYDKLKILVQEHKPQLATLAACAVMFVVGFGTGKAIGHSGQTDAPQQLDYTANSPAKPAAEVGEGAPVTAQPPAKTTPVTEDKPAETPASTGNDPVAGQPCVIKGNISGSNKIYHIKGGSSYERTSPEKCFNTEAEAVAAGFRKAKR